MVLDLLTTANAGGRKLLAILIDPDKVTGQALEETVRLADQGGADLFLVGSSLLTSGRPESVITAIRKNSRLPVVLFPGNSLQVTGGADAILFLSLISGRNADLLIGKHVIAAPYIRETGMEVIPAGYMLIDSGRPTAAQYMSCTPPIPADKPDIAACTAMAGEMLGLKTIYLEAGSGAEQAVSAEMIRKVRAAVSLPLIVGGGIRSGEQARLACEAGADLIVVGNAVEQTPGLIAELAAAIKSI